MERIRPPKAVSPHKRGEKMTWEGETWPTSTDKEAELAGSRGKKALQAKDTEKERREGGKNADDWNREAECVTII